MSPWITYGRGIFRIWSDPIMLYSAAQADAVLQQMASKIALVIGTCVKREPGSWFCCLGWKGL